MYEDRELVDLEPCPKCGFDNESDQTECSRCGIVFSKYTPERRQNQTHRDEREDSGASNDWVSGGAGRPQVSPNRRAPTTQSSSEGGFDSIPIGATIFGLASIAALVLFWDSQAAFGVTVLILTLLTAVSTWVVFEKAGEPGWAILVPIYNTYIMCRIAGRPGWWVLLFFLPIVSLIVQIVVMVGLARSFGKGVLFGLGLGLLPFVFFPILAFSGDGYGDQGGSWSSY